MRYFIAAHLLCASLVTLIARTHALSIHGKHHHAHGYQHLGSRAADASSITVSERDTASDSLSIELINNLDSANVHAYIQTTSENSDQKLLITADGNIYQPVANSKYDATPIPQDANCGIPLGAKGSSVTISMPIQLLTGRIYVADGKLDIGVLQADSGISLQNPTFQNRNDDNFNTSFGFVEANQPGKCMWANPSYVDFVGIPLGLELVTETDTLDVSGLPGNGVAEVCGQLADEQKKDGFPWDDLCLKDDDGNPIRVVSPQHSPDGFSDYFSDYIEQVWTYIASNGIKFDTQDGNPLVSCYVQGDNMFCDRTSSPFPKPTSADIWGCNSGPFANTGSDCYGKIGARFCAAFHRATLLLPGGAVQPGQNVSDYYPESFPHNKYSRIVHQVQIDHLGYTFAYDDVKPNIYSPGAEVSGTISTEGVHVLRIIVGGPDSKDAQQASPSATSEERTSDQTLISTVQSSLAGYESSQGTGSSAAVAEISSSSEATTYATRSDAQATSTMSSTSSSEATSLEPASQQPTTTQAPTIMTTLLTTTSAHPGDVPTAYSPLGGVTTGHGAVITIIETAIVIETDIVTKTTTVLQ